jgi:hypothetical protein
VPTIFISYRREDAEDPAGRLYDNLKLRFGDGNVFMDVDAIPAGVDFVAAIETAVARCDVLLAVIGTRWLTATDANGRRRLSRQGDFVRLELSAALKRGVRIIPVLVQGATMPRADDLPRPLRRLAVLNAVSLRHVSWGQDLASLCRELEQVAPAQTLTLPAALPAAAPASPPRVEAPNVQMPVMSERPWVRRVTLARWSLAVLGAVVGLSTVLFTLRGGISPVITPPEPSAVTREPAASATSTSLPAAASPTVTLAPIASPEPPRALSPEPPAATVETPTLVPTVTVAPVVVDSGQPATATPVIPTSAPLPAGPAPTPPASRPDVVQSVPLPTATSTPTVLPPTPTATSTPTATAVPATLTPTATIIACSPGSIGLMAPGGGFAALWNAMPGIRVAVGCPIAGEVGPATGTIQRFRNGSLIFWHRDAQDTLPQENTIYAVYGDVAGAWQRFDTATLQNRRPDYGCGPGGVVPVEGFGKLMVTYPDLRDRLGNGGCALAPEEPYFAATREPFELGLMLFVKVTTVAGQNPFWVFSGDTTGSFMKYTR